MYWFSLLVFWFSSYIITKNFKYFPIFSKICFFLTFRTFIPGIISCHCCCRRLYSHHPHSHLDYIVRSSSRKMLLWKCRQQQETTFGHREVSFITHFYDSFYFVVFWITEKGDFKIVKYIMSSLTFTTVTRQMLNLLIVVT